MNNNIGKTVILVLVALLVLSLVINITLFSKKDKNNDKTTHETEKGLLFIGAASAAEVYPLFGCPCCDKHIGECTCGMAAERRNYIDAVIETGGDLSGDEIVLAYVKKYGLNSFEDEDNSAKIREKLISEAPANRPIISLAPSFHDIGDVSLKAGIAITSFTIKNEGKEDLVIDDIETSCGCTSASINYRGVEGPIFAMPGHGINEEVGDWQVAIAPGEEAELKVYYDPMVHEDFRGTAIREVTVSSNDPIDSQKSVSVELNQVD